MCCVLCGVGGFITRANRGENRSANRRAEADLILRPHFLRLMNGSQHEKRGGTRGGVVHGDCAQGEAATPENAEETRARSHTDRRTRYAGRVRLHAPAAHRAK